MSLSIASEKFDDYLRVTVTGSWARADVLTVVSQVAAAADAAGRSEVLVDFRGVSGSRPEMDRFWVGEKIAQEFAARLKVSVLTRPEITSRFAETVALNRGARLRVFDSEEEALGWLRSAEQR